MSLIIWMALYTTLLLPLACRHIQLLFPFNSETEELKKEEDAKKTHSHAFLGMCKCVWVSVSACVFYFQCISVTSTLFEQQRMDRSAKKTPTSDWTKDIGVEYAWKTILWWKELEGKRSVIEVYVAQFLRIERVEKVSKIWHNHF